MEVVIGGWSGTKSVGRHHPRSTIVFEKSHTAEDWFNIRSDLNVKFEDGKVVVRNENTGEFILFTGILVLHLRLVRIQRRKHCRRSCQVHHGLDWFWCFGSMAHKSSAKKMLLQEFRQV